MKKSIRHKGAKIRMCASCSLRTRKDEHDFIRIVRAKDGMVAPEGETPLEGRSAYVCRNPECVKKLCKTRRLSHLLRTPVPDMVYDALRKEVGFDE